MADETNNESPYLAALRRSSGPQGATAVATAPAAHTDAFADAGTSAEPPYPGTDKRRSSRHKCEGSTEIREEGCDVQTWATFTDISLHGCYVEAQATYPVGINLHLKLEVNGIRVECTGSVRVNYPYLGMGIAFVEMSDENRARLKELLSTLSPRTFVMGAAPALVDSATPSTATETAAATSPERSSDPGPTVRALVEFFEYQQILTREEFFTILNKSQTAAGNR